MSALRVAPIAITAPAIVQSTGGTEHASRSALGGTVSGSLDCERTVDAAPQRVRVWETVNLT